MSMDTMTRAEVGSLTIDERHAEALVVLRDKMLANVERTILTSGEVNDFLLDVQQILEPTSEITV